MLADENLIESGYFFESDIKIRPNASKASPPGKYFPINKLDSSIARPIKQNITPSLNFHLFCIKPFI